MTDQSDSQAVSLPVEAATEGVGRRQFLKMAALLGGSALTAQTLLGSPLTALAEGTAHKPCKTHSGCKESDCKQKGCKDPNCHHTQVDAAPAITTAAATDTAFLLKAKSFEANFATIEGISANQLKQHVGLYENYVKKTNEIVAALNNPALDLSKANGTYDPYRELHVEQTFALNGAVLHEYYFDNLGGSRSGPSDALKEDMRKRFGSWNDMTSRLKALGKCMRGWVMLGFNLRDGQIHLYGLDSHNQLVPVNVVPILLLDVFEHAYMIDFGTNRGAYLDAYMANINWAPVEKRLLMAKSQYATLIS